MSRGVRTSVPKEHTANPRPGSEMRTITSCLLAVVELLRGEDVCGEGSREEFLADLKLELEEVARRYR